jgi:putative membrane protein
MSILASPTILASSDHWDGPGWWIIFPILWLLLIGGLVLFFALGCRRHGRGTGGRVGEARLAERYAAGDIDEQEYRQRLAVLKERA